MTNWRKWRDNKWYPEITMEASGKWTCKVWGGDSWMDLGGQSLYDAPMFDSPELALSWAWNKLNEMEEK